VRIIAGEFGGRRLKPPAGHAVRPTSDFVREAWFSILGPELPGAHVLDLYAGSGALGLEALSRGARYVDFVERGRRALAALEANVEALGVEARVHIHRRDAMTYLRERDAPPADIALADPPYQSDAAAELVRLFRARPFARMLCVEHSAHRPVGGDRERRYGDAVITFCYAP
jgi:16S rRNA (guanine966-N2)-methyltransferase